MWSNWLDQEITKRFLRFIDHLRLVLVLTASFLAEVKRADKSVLSAIPARLSKFVSTRLSFRSCRLKRPVPIKGSLSKCFPLAMTHTLIFGLPYAPASVENWLDSR